MLDQQTIDLIKATVPALEVHGTTITKTFYKNMFNDHPELLNIFNKTNQKQGKQPTALATTVLAAAKHIDNLGAILDHVIQIGHKHRALQIKPEHYAIVGKHLLIAIKEVLQDAATPEIIDAWAKAYQVIADAFIQVEQKMYDEAAWQDFQPFEVVGKRAVSNDIIEFTVKNDAILNGLTVQAGQYITVQVQPKADDNLALRHYSICSVDLSAGLKFAVKRESTEGIPGVVSNYLHDEVQVGDKINLSAPAGDFLLEQNDRPVVLLSGGVGITPILAMLDAQVATNAQRSLVWINATKNQETEAFKAEVAQYLAKANVAHAATLYSADQQRITAEYLAEHLPENADIYLCGSVRFMESVIGLLEGLNRPQQTIHFEPFGPKMSLIKV